MLRDFHKLECGKFKIKLDNETNTYVLSDKDASIEFKSLTLNDLRVLSEMIQEVT